MIIEKLTNEEINKIPKRLQEIRKLCGLSQETVAEELCMGCGNEKISRIENGKCNQAYDLIILNDFARYYDVSLEYILFGKDKRKVFRKMYIDEFYKDKTDKNGDIIIGGNNMINKDAIEEEPYEAYRTIKKHHFEYNGIVFEVKVSSYDFDADINLDCISMIVSKDKEIIGRYMGWVIPITEYRKDFHYIYGELDGFDPVSPDCLLAFDEKAEYKDSGDILLSVDLFIRESYRELRIHDYIRKILFEVYTTNFTEIACLNSFEDERETCGNIRRIKEVAKKYGFEVLEDFDGDTTDFLFGIKYLNRSGL